VPLDSPYRRLGYALLGLALIVLVGRCVPLAPVYPECADPRSHARHPIEVHTTSPLFRRIFREWLLDYNLPTVELGGLLLARIPDLGSTEWAAPSRNASARMTALFRSPQNWPALERGQWLGRPIRVPEELKRKVAAGQDSDCELLPLVARIEPAGVPNARHRR
jgi:hypothetical protein